ncbi:MAG: helix-turn-helix domain-containing protein [Candidatus Moraniibacteriota bacterium]|jgi:Schlafen, AlbA_2
MKNLVYFFIYFLLVSLTTLAFLRESWVTFFLSIITILAIFGLRFFFRKSTVRYPQEIEIALALFVGMSLIVDELIFVHTQSLLFEVVMHVISGALFGMIAFMLVYAMNKFHKNSLRLSPFFVSLFAFTFSIAFSLLWIIFENIIEALVSGGNMQTDSVWNQIGAVASIMVGALIVSFAGYQYLENGSNNIMGKLMGKFFATNPSHGGKLKSMGDDSVRIIKSGENNTVEFKSTLRVNLHTDEKDKRIEHAVLKTICAFLNAEGGILFVGVNDGGDVLGLGKDNFINNDKFQLHFTNLFNQHIGEQFASSIQSEVVNIDDKQVFRIDCFSSDVPVFLKEGQKEEFFIRAGAATQELQGSKLMEYIGKNF